MRVLIGSRGTIGSSIINATNFDLTFNSDNLHCMRGLDIDTVVCSAPSGNRLAVNTNQVDDESDIQQLISAFKSCNIQRIVLISTVDVLVNPNSIYGSNRLMLEEYVKSYSNYHILRLSTLVGKNIKKNVLFDLTHKQFLDKVDSEAIIQWCLLDDVYNQIERVIEHNIQELSLVSEPIKNIEIISRFFPEITVSLKNTNTFYNIQPYCYTKQQVFDAIERYLS